MDGDRGGPYWMYGAHHAHDEWWQAPLHFALALVVVGLLVVGIVWLVRRLTPAPAGATGVPPAVGVGVGSGFDDAAVAELRLRYARGEIDRDAYLTTFADLTGRAESWPGRPGPEAPTAPPPSPA